jgi:4-amino-4-deoxy-L-arabinose transferase-like glycosyltransferase
LRLPFLGHQSLWLDEVNTYSIVVRPSVVDVWNGVYQTEATPPLYYLVTWGWTQLVGSSTAMLRAPAAIEGVLCVPAAFLALRRLVGPPIALAAAALVATSPVLSFYSLDARAYSQLVLTSTLSLWSLALLLEAPSGRRWLAWLVAAAATALTHYFGVFVILAELAVIWYRLPDQRRRLAIGGGVLALVGVGVFALFTHQNAGEGVKGIAHSSLASRAEDTVRQFAMGPNVPGSTLEAAGLLLAGGGLAGGLAVLMRTGLQPGFAILGGVVLVGLGVPLLLAATGIEDRYLTRNELGLWVSIAAIAALGLSRLRALPLALYAILGTSTFLAVQADWRYQNVDWRGALARLGSDLRGRPVVVYGGQGGPVVAHYLHRRAVGGPLFTTTLWVLVSPARERTRALAPVSGPPAPGVPGPPFYPAGVTAYHGVRALRFQANSAAMVDARRLGFDSVDGAPATLLGP